MEVVDISIKFLPTKPLDLFIESVRLLGVIMYWQAPLVSLSLKYEIERY
jgi:hypothetical protein